MVCKEVHQGIQKISQIINLADVSKIFEIYKVGLNTKDLQI